mgnify:CR=1 FL=1
MARVGWEGGVVNRQYATRDEYIAAALASGKYFVDEAGTIFNTRFRGTEHSRIVVPYGHPTGYLYVTLKLDDRHNDIGVLAHRVIAFARLGPPPAAFMDVDHVDGNKRNNHPSNLQWVERDENVRRAYALGLKRRDNIGVIGEDHYKAVLTDDLVREAHRLLAGGMTRRAIAIQLGFKYQTIVSALAGVSWRHIYREFHP